MGKWIIKLVEMFTSWHVVKLGSNANNSANTGTFYMNANNTSSNVNRNISARLSWQRHFRTSKPCLLAKHITRSHWCW